jgi:hypothetical protein
MKKLTYGMILILFAATLGCQQKQTEAPVIEASRKKSGDDVAQYAIPYDSAKKGIENYSIQMGKVKSILEKACKGKACGIEVSEVTSFTVRSVDLYEAMGMKPDSSVQYNYVRIYLGIDTKNKFRLYFTPVEGADLDKAYGGKDVILSGQYTSGKNSTNSAGQVEAKGNGEYMMDFALPCPTICPN